MSRAVDAQDRVARLLGRHCAGLAPRPSPKAILAYLHGPARADESREHIDFAARSLLNGCSVPDVLELVVDCGVSAARLIAHADALSVTRKPTLACLAQLTLAD